MENTAENTINVGAEPTVAKAKKEPKAPKEKRPALPSQNGATRPASGTRTGFVWETADELAGQLGRAPTRGEVMKVCTEAGINQATITTQLGHWRRFHGLVSPRGPKEAVLPAEVLAETATAVQLTEEGEVAVESSGIVSKKKKK